MMTQLDQALVTLELSGTWTPEAWPTLRQALLTTTDPALAAAAAPLRELIAAQEAMRQAQAVVATAQAALTAATTPTEIAAAAQQLALAAEELAGRSHVVASRWAISTL